MFSSRRLRDGDRLASEPHTSAERGAQNGCVRLGAGVAPQPDPFTLIVPDTVPADLGERLGPVRLPGHAPEQPLPAGADVSHLRNSIYYWPRGGDWPGHEAALKRLPQFRALLPEIDLDVLHVPGKARPHAAYALAWEASLGVHGPRPDPPPDATLALRQ